jgi:hypothetical protein
MVQAGDTIVQVARWLRQKRVSSAERYLADLDRASHEKAMAERAAKFLGGGR